MAFAPVDLLTAIKAACRAADIRCPHRLTVDNRCTRLGLASSRSSHGLAQGGVDGFPNTAQTPSSKIVVDRLPVRKLMRQPFPAAARLSHVKHGIEQLASRYRCLSSVRFRFWNQSGYDRPLLVTQIGPIAH